MMMLMNFQTKSRLEKINKNMRNRIAIILTLLVFHISVFAEIPDRPNPPRLVNDFASVLNQKEYNSLEGSLEQFARETSTQIVVVTVEDLDGYEPYDYVVRLGDKWGVGQEGKDNGIVILLKPKQGNSKGQVFVGTGYGLEGVLPDAVVNGTVIDNEMIPRFKQDDYYGGLVNGIKVIMDITRGEYTAAQYQKNVAGQKSGGIPFIVIFILFFVIVPILRGRRRRFYSPGRSLPFWLAMGMMSGRSSHHGTFNNFSSGSGGFGGGGFGGFGGGSFGGGGAGGSW
jgi:uncharacterized protein